jgi:hypothetical protein
LTNCIISNNKASATTSYPGSTKVVASWLRARWRWVVRHAIKRKPLPTTSRYIAFATVGRPQPTPPPAEVVKLRKFFFALTSRCALAIAVGSATSRTFIKYSRGKVGLAMPACRRPRRCDR